MWDYYRYLVDALGLPKIDAYVLTMERYNVKELDGERAADA